MKIHIGFTGFCCSLLFFVKLELAHTNMTGDPEPGECPVVQPQRWDLSQWICPDGPVVSRFLRPNGF